MTRKRAKSMDQTSSRTLDAVGVLGKPRGPLMASSEPSRMLAFTTSKDSSGECRFKPSAFAPS